MKNYIVKSISATVFTITLVVNYLSNSLPLNERTPGEISDMYANLFAPAGLTFSIWGLIYFLLIGYVIHNFLCKEHNTEKIFNSINPLFIGTSIANTAWIFAWHYDFIGLSLVVMIMLLILLIRIAKVINSKNFYSLDKLFIWLPFSIYFGWITVATIANVTVFLVSIGWDGFGIAEDIWTVLVLLISSVIGGYVSVRDKNYAYALVFSWAYLGIFIKHASDDGFDLQYLNILTTSLILILVFLYIATYTFRLKEYKKTSG